MSDVTIGIFLSGGKSRPPFPIPEPSPTSLFCSEPLLQHSGQTQHNSHSMTLEVYPFMLSVNLYMTGFRLFFSDLFLFLCLISTTTSETPTYSIRSRSFLILVLTLRLLVTVNSYPPYSQRLSLSFIFTFRTLR